MANKRSAAYRQITTRTAKGLGVFDYCNGEFLPSDFSTVKHKAVLAFEKECSELFAFSPLPDEKRHEQIRPLIVKVLLYVGFLPTKQTKSIIARMIELLAIDPSADIDRFIADVAFRTNTDVDSIKKTIERAFDPYDKDVVDKVESLTGTKPFSSRDIIYDLALYVRKRYIGRSVYA